MTDDNKSESARYWEQHLLSWEASAYYRNAQARATWWDRLSTIFRGDAMYVRMQAALELLRPYLPGKTVLDVGCGGRAHRNGERRGRWLRRARGIPR